jgi:hypothetical protein
MSRARRVFSGWMGRGATRWGLIVLSGVQLSTKVGVGRRASGGRTPEGLLASGRVCC